MMSAYLITPLSNTPKSFAPENSSLSTKKFVLTSHDDMKPLDSTGLPMTNKYLQKVHEEMEISKKKILEKILEIDHQIYVQKLPFLQYYDPVTEKIKTQQEIKTVIKNSFDFFQADASLFKGSQYKPEAYYFATPKSKKNLTQLPEKKASIVDFMTPDRELKTKKEVEYSSEKKPVKPYLKQFYAKESLMDGSLKGDDEVLRFSEEASTQVETVPSIQIPSSEKSLGEEKKTGFRMYEKEKIPAGLYKGTLKRKIILKEIKKNNEKTLERRGSGIQILRASEGRAGMKNLSSLVKERTDEIIETPRKPKEINLKTRSPINNAFYQVLVMPSTQREVMGKKLNIPLENLQSVKRRDWKSTSVRNE